jgi:hypothetical protein
LSNCHGRVCTVVCEECGTERLINTQDAFQVTRCLECQAKHVRKVRKESRQKRLARRRAAKANAQREGKSENNNSSSQAS